MKEAFNSKRKQTNNRYNEFAKSKKNKSAYYNGRLANYLISEINCKSL